jgi:hypothetical protein
MIKVTLLWLFYEKTRELSLYGEKERGGGLAK